MLARFRVDSPFTVHARDVWLVPPVLASQHTEPIELTAALAARRIFNLSRLPEDFTLVLVHGEFSWDAPCPASATGPATLYVWLAAAAAGALALWIGWMGPSRGPGIARDLRSPESFRCLFREWIPTYSESFRKACLRRHLNHSQRSRN